MLSFISRNAASQAIAQRLGKLQAKKQLKDRESFSTESGLTLIECLVAIAVIASTIGVIAPITILSVATRVQNQRAEQATLLAQAEIDRVRLTMERRDNPTFDNIASITNTTPLLNVGAPEDIDVSTASTVHTAARPVDINSDGDVDFAIQVFRSEGMLIDGELAAFELGVRVYRAKAVDDFSASNLDTSSASLSMTSGEGQAATRPLAVLYTTIVRSDDRDSLCDYYQYIDDSAATVPGACT